MLFLLNLKFWTFLEEILLGVESVDVDDWNHDRYNDVGNHRGQLQIGLRPDPGVWIGLGSGSFGRIRVIWTDQDPGVLVGSGSGCFGRFRIRIMNKVGSGTVFQKKRLGLDINIKNPSKTI